MDMSLESISAVLTAWEEDPAAAQRLIQAHANEAEKRLASVMLAARLLLDEISAEKEQLMSFTINEEDKDLRRVQRISEVIRNVECSRAVCQ